MAVGERHSSQPAGVRVCIDLLSGVNQSLDASLVPHKVGILILRALSRCHCTRLIQLSSKFLPLIDV